MPASTEVEIQFPGFLSFESKWILSKRVLITLAVLPRALQELSDLCVFIGRTTDKWLQACSTALTICCMRRWICNQLSWLL